MPDIKGNSDAIIIGAGPAGMMAAIVCAESGLATLVIDKNDVTGRKLRITGKGRCNLTNDCTPEEVIAATTKNGRFLYSAVNVFSPQDTIDFLENMQVKLKTERGKRVFPVSDRADDIADALERKAVSAGVKIIKDKASEIIVENKMVKGVKTNNNIYRSKNVVIFCGGSSYPLTGSDGSGVCPLYISDAAADEGAVDSFVHLLT